jgi:hypothetical protein
MTDPSMTDHTEPANTYGRAFWIGAALGWLMIGYGVKILLADPEANWKETARLVAISIVAHDVVWLGVSVGAGWLVARALGRPAAFWIRWASWTTCVLIVMAFPLVRRYGDRFGNDTILPRDYTTSLIVLVVLVWIAAAAYGAIARHHSPGHQSPG